jgi:hypothetical protein
MIIKYIRVNVNELPKIPSYAKLVTDFLGEETESIKWGQNQFFRTMFEYKEGTLQDGSKQFRSGLFMCTVYGSSQKRIDSQNNIKKFSKKELRDIHFVKVISPFNFLAVEIAVRAVLVERYKFKDLYSGWPFRKII